MTLWVTARGLGLAALVLLTAATCLGTLASRSGRPARRYLTQYLHRATAGLALLVLAGHVAAILADSESHVGWRGALIPFTSGYRPTAVALGSLAAFTLLAVAVLGLARGRLAAHPRAARTWRMLHGFAYAAWILAVIHGFTAGTDSGVGWVRVLFAGCLVTVATALGLRVWAGRHAAPAGGPDVPDRFAAVLTGATR